MSEQSLDSYFAERIFGHLGMADTRWWVAEEITAMFFTQLLPESTYPLRTRLRQLVYSALVD